MSISEAVATLVKGVDLTRAETEEVMDAVMSGDATPAQIAGFLVALKSKGETVDEVAGAASVMRQKATKIPHNQDLVVDTCGTGGDHSGTFNISTTAALVVAGAGVPVAKHGNRSITSDCGSADVLEALGVNIEATPEVVGKCVDQVRIGFMFAPLLHSAMKHAVPVRKELAPTPTVFNMLGPLTNPAGSRNQVIGVFSLAIVEPMAEVLRELGASHSFVVHGSDGLDEITTTASTTITELKAGEITTTEIRPDQFGIAPASLHDLKGGSTEKNAAITRQVLDGELGPQRDIVLLNAAAALVASEAAKDIDDGIGIAASAIANGGAARALEGLREISHG